MSSIKDEIDWEFPGNQTTTGQTNYFWQGVIRKFWLYYIILQKKLIRLPPFPPISICDLYICAHACPRDYQKLHIPPV